MFFLGSSLKVLIVIIAHVYQDFLVRTNHCFKGFTYLHIVNTCNALTGFMCKTMLKRKSGELGNEKIQYLGKESQ